MKPLLALPLVALVIVLPALLPPVDLAIGGQVIYGERLVYIPATVALGLWASRRAALAVLAGGAACLAAIALPRGGEWPSFSYADAFLCAAVAWALVELVREQTDWRLGLAAAIAAALWVTDALVMAPWCGALVGFEFTSSTACGSAIGASMAAIPAYVATASWLALIRWQAR